MSATETPAPPWLELACTVPASLADEAAALLVELSGNGVVQENRQVDTFSLDSLEAAPLVTIRAYFPATADMALPLARLHAWQNDHAAELAGLAGEPTITPLATEDWASNWRQHFVPTRIGRRLVVKPSWEEWPAGNDDLVLELDPGMAFGTGTHATTTLCLAALEERADCRGIFHGEAGLRSVLDVGTGSGILAIAAAKLGASQVVGIDIDADAIRVAADNAARNGVTAALQLSTLPLAEVPGTFQLLLANILAEDLVAMAPALLARLAAGGSLVLSGILNEREALVQAGFAPYPLTLLDCRRQADWSCLVYRKDA